MGKGERRGEHLHVETLVAMRRVERAPRAAWACPLRRAGARVPRLDARGGSSPPDEGGNHSEAVTETSVDPLESISVHDRAEREQPITGFGRM